MAKDLGFTIIQSVIARDEAIYYWISTPHFIRFAMTKKRFYGLLVLIYEVIFPQRT